MDLNDISCNRYEYQHFRSSLIRSAAADKAYSQVPFETVLKTGGWCSMCTFSKQYHKTISAENQSANKLFIFYRNLIVQYNLLLLQ